MAWTANIFADLLDGGLNGIKISGDELSWIGSFSVIGAGIMCLFIGPICDLIGRRFGNLLIAVPLIVGWIIIIMANSVTCICVGRCLTGFGIGGFCVSAPMYTSEIAEKEIRGTLGSFFQLFLSLGILFAFVTGYLCDPKQHSIACSVLPVVFVVVFVTQPESPVFLLKKDQPDKARNALLRLRGSDYNVDGELKEIKAGLDASAALQGSLSEAFQKRTTVYAAFLAISLLFFQQFGGINVVVFYTSDIFSSAGLTMNPKIGTIITGIFQLIASLGGSLLIDKLGRKILLLISGAGMAVSLAIVGIFMMGIERGYMSSDTIKKFGIIPVIAVTAYLMFFALGYGPIPWIALAELLPPEVQGLLASIAGFLCWCMTFFLTSIYSYVKTSIGSDSMFFIFAGVSTVGVVFVIFFAIETKGKSIEEIQQLLSS